MFEGRLVQILISPTHRTEPTPVDRAEAVPQHGLVGDRHYSPDAPLAPDKEITLIEEEAFEHLAKTAGITLVPGQARRNLLTRGVPLNDLVGREFTVGELTLRGMRPCHPCQYLESLTQPGVRAGLTNRGGLRAQIVRGGVLRPGDPIRPAGERPSNG